METEGPVGDLGGCADDLCVLARDLDRIRGAASQEIEVDHSSDDVVFERRAGVRLIDLDVHSIRVEEEHAMRTGGAMLEVDRVVSV